MKKLLFLAFTAILGMSVNAQETLLSERPEGIVKVYDRAGKGIKLQQGDDGSLEMRPVLIYQKHLTSKLFSWLTTRLFT